MKKATLISVVLVCCTLFLSNLSAQQFPNSSFVLDSIKTQPGTMSSVNLNVPDGSDKGTFIPVTVIQGSKPGPVLSLIAGIHGSEYAPILALQKLRKQLDPKQLAGTIILVHIANVPAFLGRSIYVNPIDGKNLNREFPGSAEGTLSERIAHTLSEQVIQPADYVMDIHCGDANESMYPYLLYVSKTPDPEISEKSRRMAQVFGINHIWIVPYDFRSIDQPPLYCDYAAVRMGKPTLLVESGESGNRDEESIDNIVKGVWNVIYDLKMFEGTVQEVQNAIEIVQDAGVDSKVEGIFYPLTEAGSNVEKDERIGYITDYFGNIISDVYAPISGMVMCMIGTPPVKVGDPLFTIGKTMDQ